MTQKTLLDKLETDLRDLLERARQNFARQPLETLRAKPGPAQWNALECFAHLNAFFEAYFAPVERAIHKAKARHWAAQPDAPLRYNATGRIALRHARLSEGKKYKTQRRYDFGRPPRKGKPVPPPLGPDALKSFIINLEKLLRVVRAAREADINRATVPKAHAWLGRYTLGNLLEWLVVHAQRHMLQAETALLKTAA